MEEALISRQGRHPRTIRVDGIPVVLTTARIDIHLRRAQPALLLPEVAADPEDENHRQCEHVLEPTLDVVELAVFFARRRDSAEKLLCLLTKFLNCS